MKTQFLVSIMAAVSCGAVACGDASDEVLPDASGPAPDARVSTNDAPVAPVDTAYAVGTDFTTSGVLSAIDVGARQVTPNVVAGVASTDPALRYFGGKLYLINRFGADNITIVDPSTNQLVTQISTGAGTNPQDVAVKGSKIYVAALASGDVIILDEANPSAPPQTIDISSYDPDGVPDAHSLYLVGDLLFVSLEHLDETFASQGGSVLVIDTTSDTVIDTITLTHNNPFGSFTYNEATAELLITTTVDFATTGCVQRIQTTSPFAVDCLVDNADLGGYAGRIAVHDGTVWLSVNASFTEAYVVSLDSDDLPQSPLTPATQQATDLAVCPSGAIVVSDQTAGGVRIYEAGGEVTTEVLDLGLPPSFAGGIVCF